MSSKKLRSVQGGAGDELKIDMSPMIDMVFLLLIFFLVNASLVIVKMDKRVTIPVATNSNRQSEKKGRIVINVYGDEHSAEGRFRMEDGKTVFGSDEDMEQFIKDEKEKMDALGVIPKIHLRGDRDSLFKYSRRVIRVAAKAGVNQVIFVSYATDKGQ
ncbi:MAG: biopolymer transporter ExbD [Verrucomicrobia bacterium]|nr:biopolymer transporter ExbD [Verrucomicrobiota bacterium]MDA1005169.1 biopolymer transporter ExbD [Verrucomicrobiota bacterium]